MRIAAPERLAWWVGLAPDHFYARVHEKEAELRNAGKFALVKGNGSYSIGPWPERHRHKPTKGVSA